jgi:hypothetical protein
MASRAQQKQRQPPPPSQQQKKPAPVVKKNTGFLHPSINFASYFEPAPLSPHPDVDRYLPRLLVGSAVAVTGILSMIELLQMYVFTGQDDELPDGDVDPDGSNGPVPQFTKRLHVLPNPIPVEQWSRNVEGKLIFAPCYEWQEVPENCVCPPGLEYKIDTQTGQRLARAPPRK